MLGFHVRFTEYCITLAVPFNDCTVGELTALLTNERVPVMVPALVGVKVTVKLTDWPTATVTGNEIPLRANIGLLMIAEETVTLEVLAVSCPP